MLKTNEGLARAVNETIASLCKEITVAELANLLSKLKMNYAILALLDDSGIMSKKEVVDHIVCLHKMRSMVLTFKDKNDMFTENT